MIPSRLACALLLACVTGAVQADIYKCTDEQGHVTYTNQKTAGKGCALLSKDQAVSTIEGPRRSAAAAPQATPSGFPKVDGDTQRKRDGDRRKILEQELASEEKGLDDARKDLSEQESVRMGDEKNYQRVIERLQPYKDKVALHERNIEALKKEIGNLR